MGKDELLLEQDLRQACIHAAGHAMVSRKLGYQSSWWVWQGSESGRDGADWFARNELIGEIQPRHRGLIGLAGAVAVALAGRRQLSSAELYQTLTASADEENETPGLSSLDAELAVGFNVDTVSDCRSMVLELLGAIREEARERPDVATQVKRAKSRQYYA